MSDRTKPHPALTLKWVTPSGVTHYYPVPNFTVNSGGLEAAPDGQTLPAVEVRFSMPEDRTGRITEGRVLVINDQGTVIECIALAPPEPVAKADADGKDQASPGGEGGTKTARQRGRRKAGK